MEVVLELKSSIRSPSKPRMATAVVVPGSKPTITYSLFFEMGAIRYLYDELT